MAFSTSEGLSAEQTTKGANLSRTSPRNKEDRQPSSRDADRGSLRLALIAVLLLLTGGTLLAGWQVTSLQDSDTVAQPRRPQHRRPRIPSRSHRFNGYPQAL